LTRLFDRDCTLKLHDKQFRSDHYDGSRHVPGWRITFAVEHSLEKDGCKAEVTIENLSETSRARLDAVKHPRIELEAGYVGDRGLIYSGELSNVVHEYVGTGYVTRLSSNTAQEARRGILHASLPPGAKVAEAIETVAKALGVNAKRAIEHARAGRFDGTVRKFFAGKTFAGYAYEAMDDLAETLGFAWIIQNGELVILRENDLLPDEALVVGPGKGLIETPRVVIDQKQDKKTARAMTGAKIQLMPRVMVGRKLMFTHPAFPGVYRIVRAKYTGDTHGADWIVETESTRIAT
jgi:hypothetical protein